MQRHVLPWAGWIPSSRVSGRPGERLFKLLGIALLAGLAAGSLPLRAQTVPATVSDAAHQELTKRIAAALARTRNLKVVYQDTLGEGPGTWDPNPRYPKGEVNCI